LFSAEFYRSAVDEAVEMPADKLELSLSVDNKPVQLRLDRSNSIPADLPVILSTRNNRLTYWTDNLRAVSVACISSYSVCHFCFFSFSYRYFLL